MIPALQNYIKNILPDTKQVPESRKLKLEEITRFVSDKLKSSEPANLIFICTQNSRRSHMSQIWAQTAAHYFNLENVHCFSGGTEATAFNPRAVKAMSNAGFSIAVSDEANNPVYLVQYADEVIPIKAFSKKYNDSFNPQDSFCAVMTCSDADEACPLVFGASARVSIPYEDPKEADDTEEEADQYSERCRQIATEMFYLFSQVDR